MAQKGVEQPLKNMVLYGGLLAFAGAALGLLLIEACLRFNSAYSFSSMTEKAWRLVKNRYRTSGTFGYELIPNCAPDVNSFGMRDREYTREKGKNVFRIMVLGDSITEWGEWSDYLEEMLNQKGGYEILNCAVAGWNLYQYHEYAWHRAKIFKPDLVLIGFCLNDIPDSMGVKTLCIRTGQDMVDTYSISGRNRAGAAKMLLKANPRLFEASALYRFIVYNLYLRTKGAGDGAQADPTDGLLLGIRSATNDRVLGVVFPFIKPLNEYDVHKIRELDFRQEREFYDETIAALDKAGIDYLDLTGTFNAYGRDVYRFRRDPHDQVHFNEAGNKLIAQTVYPWLTRKIKQLEGGGEWR